jgi:hypothetical protein
MDELTPITITAPRLAPPPVRPGQVTADDYIIDEIRLVTPTDNMDVRTVSVEISYYEDIFRGSVTGHVLISDSLSLIERLSMSGNDFLYMSFRKSSFDTTKVQKYFRIYRVSERHLTNDNTEVYSLHFCSEELLLSEQMKISKSYNNKPISDIVKDILLNHLKVPAKQVNVQDTEGMYDFVIPYKKPFDAINWLANYALTEKTGADYMFYENIKGFNFNSLQSLYSQEVYAAYAYTARNSNFSDLSLNMSAIKSYTFLDTFDTLYGTTSGAFANKLITIDPLTRQYYKTEFDSMKNYYDKKKTLNGQGVYNDLKNRLGKTANENYDAVLKIMVSNKDQKKAEGISDKPWSVANDIRAESYVTQRTSQLALSHYTRLKIVVSGDPNLTVGSLVDVTLPSSLSSTKQNNGFNSGKPDPYNSGKYLITAVRHKINTEMKYETILELAKDSFTTEISTFGDNPTVNLAVKGQ